MNSKYMLLPIDGQNNLLFTKSS